MRPMLAAQFDERYQKFPVYGSPKLDGVRAIPAEDGVLSRTRKRFPNYFLQKRFSAKEYRYIDGELCAGPFPNAPDVYLSTMRLVMSHNGEGEIWFYAFDFFDLTKPFYLRYKMLRELWLTGKLPHVRLVEQKLLHNLDEVYAYEEKCLKWGYEGIVLRDPQGKYKQGRSTVKEGGMVKLKRFTDADAEIIGCEELMINSNEQEKNELGYAHRSSAKAGLIPANILGALLCRDCKTKVEFSIGTGFTTDVRQKLWDRRGELLGKYVKYKHFGHGEKDKPRHPVFLGFRADIDL